ncbi:hypothetical protein BVX93_02305, partial [bacterium B13(2017)]
CDINYFVTEYLNCYLTYAYLDAEDKTSNTDLPTQPRHKVHAGIYYSLWNSQLKWFLDLFYASERSRYFWDASYRYEEKAEDYFLVNTTIRLENVLYSNFHVSLTINNLLYERYKRQNYVIDSNEIDDFERTGISFYLKGTLKI